MEDKKLDGNGLMRVWLKIWTLIKLLVGDVDVSGKGDLQTQINNLGNKVNNCLGSDNGDVPGFAEGLEAENVIDAINKLFTQGNENKQTLVDNLIAMGIQASTDDTWGTLLDKVLDMTDTSRDTVTAATLLAGYTAHNASGDPITGTMPEKGAWTANTTGNGNVPIPAGHHNGQGYVSGAGAYNKGVTDADGRVNTNSANYKGGYNAGVSATKKGTAVAGDVLSGKTFTNSGSVGASGTMANKGNTTQDAAVTQDATYTYLTVPANGYYNTASKLRARNSNLATQVKTGYISNQTINLGFVPDFVAFYCLVNDKLSAHIVDNRNNFNHRAHAYNGDTNQPKININGTTIQTSYSGYYTAIKF